MGFATIRDGVMVTAVLGTLAIGGIVALRPDPGVAFEAELSRLEPEEALQRLRAAEGRIPFHDNLLLLHARLSLGDGDLDGARRLFLQLLEQAGPSDEVLETLAEIEAASGHPGRAAVFLRRAHELSPTPERRLRLGGWYRALRLAGAERALLTAAGPADLSAPEVGRLGHLLIAAGQVAQYRALLVVLADGDGAGRTAFRQRLLEHLVEEGRPAEAVAFATSWAGQAEPAETLEASVRALIGRGAIDAAILVARAGFRVAPGDGHVVLPVFARSGHGGPARLLQDEWLAGRATLSEAEWATLSALAEQTGDMRGVQQALARAGHLASPGARGQALVQVMRYRGAAALVPYRGLLDDQVLAEVPLVGAGWSAWRGDRAATYAHLLAAAGQPLGGWDQTIWMALVESLRGSPYHRALLAGAVDNPDLRQRLRDSVMPPRPADVTAAGSAATAG
ncbi:hypothetical protein E4191_22020 (plasmid) [Paracoccus liaowanqingii]|uniref:Tetratricopeptide repeat protein n=1 Tax=Paracoccus liaowanqingii TaxID=2560053 RepID=A0A4Y5STR2_9RHOB|nr:hypothetical protein [Paracoccus liaowanqingii]QDA36749.1 hypothetical protein E4191_22020 [Paracoccus liaowanqingii]